MNTNVPKITFDDFATPNEAIRTLVQSFVASVLTLETQLGMPIVVFQDGPSFAYYIKVSLQAQEASKLCDLNAKLDTDNPESYRANRELQKRNKTYEKMVHDASLGREFNDIIVEYNVDYDASTPLKVWGGQHRISAIMTSYSKVNRFHGFRIYFSLSKDQRTEVALISNTNIAVSNDTFDRMVEETKFGDVLRKWCQKVGLLGDGDNFPDVSSKADAISVKRARSFVVNFYLGKQEAIKIGAADLDRHVYEPYLASSGVAIDRVYEEMIRNHDILSDEALIAAGKYFAQLHHAQQAAAANVPALNRKSFKNKALVESVLCGWAYVAGLLQTHPERLANHFQVPRITAKIRDPLSAEDMSQFKHETDPPTYRGLGTRSSLKDRQRVAQLFLARSLSSNAVFDKKLMDKAVSQVVGLLSTARGYS